MISPSSLNQYLKCCLFTLLFSVSVMLVATSAENQTSKTELELNRLLFKLLNNNPELKSLKANWESFREKAAIAGALPNPKFTFGYFVEPVETRTGPQQSKLGLAQKFPWFGRLSAEKKSFAQAAGAYEMAWRSAQEEQALRLAMAYLDASYATKALSIIDREINLVDAIKASAERIYASSTHQVGQEQVIRLSLLANEMRDQKIDFSKQLDLARYRIEQLIDEPLPPQMMFSYSEAYPLYRDGLLEAQEEADNLDFALTNRPEYLATSFQINAAQFKEKVSKLDRLPSFTLGFDYIFTGNSSSMPRPSDSGKDAAFIFIALDLPIWANKQMAQIKESKSQVRRYKEVQASVKTLIVKDIADAKRALSSANESIRLYQESLLPESIRARELVLATYAKGGQQFLDVLDTELNVLKAELGLAQQESNKLKATWGLLRSLGILTKQ